MRVTGIALLACLASASFVPAAVAAESRYTSIANKDCKFDRVGNKPGDAEDQVKRCRGLGGARVVVNAYHATVRIGFEWPGHPKVEPVEGVVTAWSAGMKVEWRGAKSAKGFEPHAATIRMLFPDEATGKARHSVLAVMRIRRGEACLTGVVDVAANKDAYELARGLADAAPSFDCTKDKPKIAGKETEWAKAVVSAEKL